MARKPKKKNLGGRPPLPPDKLRRRRVVAMVTDAEYEQLARHAKSAGTPLGVHARKLLIWAVDPQPRVVRVRTEAVETAVPMMKAAVQVEEKTVPTREVRVLVNGSWETVPVPDWPPPSVGVRARRGSGDKET